MVNSEVGGPSSSCDDSAARRTWFLVFSFLIGPEGRRESIFTFPFSP
jgi:hypothetical protein